MTDQSLPPASALADVLLIRGLQGVLSPPLHHASGEPRSVAGRARTVQFTKTEPGQGATFDDLYALLDEDLRGHVLVAAGAEDVVGAVWGQILSVAAIRAGALGIAVAGSVRDITQLRTAPLPVWALSEHTMGATGQTRVSAVDVPVTIGGVPIEVGDTMVMDDGGVVRLMAAESDVLLEQGRAYADAEDRLLRSLEAGVPLVDAYDHKRVVRKQLQQW